MEAGRTRMYRAAQNQAIVVATDELVPRNRDTVLYSMHRVEFACRPRRKCRPGEEVSVWHWNSRRLRSPTRERYRLLILATGRPRSPAPALYTHDQEDRSPELNSSGLPAGTKSLTLIMAESDNTASARTACVHWILYDLPPHATGLTEAAKQQDLPAGSREGLNDWKHLRYDGPCSPIERRRYLFELYALDTAFPDLNWPTRVQLERAMQGHVLEQVSLAGTYRRHP